MKNISIRLVILLFAFGTQALAQTERIQLGVGNFYVPNSYDNALFKPFLKQLGLSYSYELNNSFALKANYTRWFRLNQISSFKPSRGNGYTEEFNPNSEYTVGEISNRFNYQLFDLSCVYKMQLKSKHELYGSAGLSYTWGKYDKIITAYRSPGNLDWLIQYQTLDGRHIGLVCEFGYNYLIVNNRINVGLSESIRAYSGLPVQLYFNLNLGYNFELIAKRKSK